MDNFRIDITDNRNLTEWLTLCMGQHRRAEGWSAHNDDKGQRIIFYWHPPFSPSEQDEYTPLPVPVDASNVSSLVQAWLDKADYGKQPDHDGSNSRGFRIYNEAWGFVDNKRNAIFAVQPVWAMHGK